MSPFAKCGRDYYILKKCKKQLKFKFILGIIIFMISFICVDGLCARFFNTRPIIAKKEIVYNEITDVGVVYKSIFADVYYCDTIIEIYNDKDELIFTGLTDSNGKIIIDELK